MTDEVFDTPFGRDLRSMLAAQAPDDVPQSLRTFVSAVPARETGIRASHPYLTRFALLASAAVIAVMAVGVLLVVFQRPPTNPISAPTFTAEPSPLETQPPSSPSAIPTLAPTAFASPLAAPATYRFQVISSPPTLAEQASIEDIVARRLSVFEGATLHGNVTVSDSARGIFNVTLVPATNYPVFASALTQLGNVAVAAVAGQSTPGQTLDPSWPVLFSNGEAHDTTGVAFWSDFETGQENVELDLSPSAAESLATWSSANVGDALAIAVDGTIVIAATVDGPMTDGKITVTFPTSDIEAAKRLEAALSAEPLSHPLRLLEQVAIPTD